MHRTLWLHLSSPILECGDVSNSGHFYLWAISTSSIGGHFHLIHIAIMHCLLKMSVSGGCPSAKLHEKAVQELQRIQFILHVALRPLLTLFGEHLSGEEDDNRMVKKDHVLKMQSRFAYFLSFAAHHVLISGNDLFNDITSCFH